MGKNALDVEVDISGVDFGRVTQRLEAGAKRALPGAAEDIADEASRLAPEDSGEMARSITVRILPDEAIIGPTVDYAEYVEFGTRYMPAQPFMRPAIRQAARTLKNFRDIL